MLKQLLLIISLSGLMGCTVSPSPETPNIHLKDIKFPDEDFGKFIAANHVRKTEEFYTHTARKEPETISIFDSLGRIIKQQSGSFFSNTDHYTYDSNGLVVRRHIISCTSNMYVIQYVLNRQKLLLEENWIGENRRFKHLHLLDSTGKVYFSMTGIPEALYFTSYHYNADGTLSGMLSSGMNVPGLRPVPDNLGAYKTIKTFTYKDEKPALVIEKQYCKDHHVPYQNTITSLYDDRGLILKTITDDSTAFSYTHQTHGDIDTSKFLLRVL